MIYLASPYNDNDPNVRERRYLAACKACAHLAAQGEVVYSPIVHWHNIANMYDLPRDFDFWANIDEHMIKLCSLFMILQIDSWEISKGIKEELALAKLLNKEISLWRMVG